MKKSRMLFGFGAIALMLCLAGCGSDEPDKGYVEHRFMIPEQIPQVSLDLPESVEMVDLGLSVLWANCNLGANVPEEYGGYFAWGDPTGELWSADGIGFGPDGYTWNTTNYGGNMPQMFEIGGTTQDVVTQHWRNGWRTPSLDEAAELCNDCQWILHEQNGRKWYEVIGPNGNSIVMPLGGIYGDSPEQGDGRFEVGPFQVNANGCYWTSSISKRLDDFGNRGYPVSPGVVMAWSFHCNSKYGDLTGTGKFLNNLRAFHMSIRPVHDK